MTNLRESFPWKAFLMAWVVGGVMAFMFSAMPWLFIFLVLGKTVQLIPVFRIYLDLFKVMVFLGFTGMMAFVSSWVYKRVKRRRIIRGAASFSVVVLMLLVAAGMSSGIFLPQVLRAGDGITVLVRENRDLSLPAYVEKVTWFLNDHVQFALNKPEYAFKIDVLLWSTWLDPVILRFFGVTQGAVIIYQGWGSCEEAAVLIEELLARAEYPVRRASCTDLNPNHMWAEVYSNGTWWIVDPWYVHDEDSLYEIGRLSTFDDAFRAASGVKVRYPNGTIVDASAEHGY